VELSCLISKAANLQEATLQSKLTCLWTDTSAPKKYRTAVSLHSHTSHSKEGLYFVAEYASRQPLLNWALTTYSKRSYTRGGITTDFQKAYWTPPLLPLAAFRVERDQIERDLDLASIVSITDHDNIEAPTLLQVVPEGNGVPVSVEWTVPYKNGVLHVGIHNLPPARAEAIMAQFAEYTENPRNGRLRDLFAMLDENPEVLIVLNHPLWDLAGIGQVRHIHLLHDFIAELGMFVHAFELSGVRSWKENRAVFELAEKWNQLVVSGGDRHGAEPNAVLNLTNTQTFSEFTDEVRRKRHSHVLFMPQYADPYTLRVFQSLLDTIREYPDRPKGSRMWDERVFHPDSKGEVRSLAEMWAKPPIFVTAFFAAARMLEIPFVRSAVAALGNPEQDIQFALDRGQEATFPWARSHALHSSRTRTRKSTAWPTLVANMRRSRQNEGSPS